MRKSKTNPITRDTRNESRGNVVNNKRNESIGQRMKLKHLRIALVVTAIALVAGVASAQDITDLHFKGAVGVIPVTGVAANGTVNLNVVRGVQPGAPWRIASLTATVDSRGRINVRGKGLLLASGNGIGTNAGQSVHASLFCGTGNTITEHDSILAGVPLAANGDFTIDDVLTPPLPSPCTAPVLLIRNVGGVWFAAGILNQGPAQ
jgi:hypothetical protein